MADAGKVLSNEPDFTTICRSTCSRNIKEHLFSAWIFVPKYLGKCLFQYLFKI